MPEVEYSRPALPVKDALVFMRKLHELSNILLTNLDGISKLEADLVIAQFMRRVANKSQFYDMTFEVMRILK